MTLDTAIIVTADDVAFIILIITTIVFHNLLSNVPNPVSLRCLCLICWLSLIIVFFNNILSHTCSCV